MILFEFLSFWYYLEWNTPVGSDDSEKERLAFLQASVSERKLLFCSCLQVLMMDGEM